MTVPGAITLVARLASLGAVVSLLGFHGFHGSGTPVAAETVILAVMTLLGHRDRGRGERRPMPLAVG